MQERRQALRRAHRLMWDVLVRGRYAFIYDQIPLQAVGMSGAKRWNLLLAGANLVIRKLRPWSMPLHMQLELTNYCNLRCPVCPTGSRAVQRKPMAMDVGLCERLFEDVGPYLLTVSLWAWGEPLLHPRLEEILKVVRRHPVVTLLSTNGQNLDNDRVLQALGNEPPDQLILAIDGLTDETNSRFRIGARLAPVLEGVSRLAEIKRARGLARPALHMRFIVMKHNEHEVSKLEEFARRHGFEHLSVRSLLTIDSASGQHAHGGMLPEEPSLRAYRYEDGARVRRNDFVCVEPFWFPTVFADGTLVPCEQDFNAQLSLGVTGSGVSFTDLWYSPRAAQMRRTIRDDPGSLSFCRNCPYIDRPATDCTLRMNSLIAGPSPRKAELPPPAPSES